MAQTTNIQPRVRGSVFARNVLADVPATGNTSLLGVRCANLEQLGIYLNSADQALDAFIVEARTHPDGAWFTVTNAVTATPTAFVLAASATLASLAANTPAWAIFNVRPFYEVRFSASAAVNGADITIEACGK